MKRLRMGLIGAWNRGGLVNAINQHPDWAAEVVAGADISPGEGAHGGADELIANGFVEMLHGRHKPSSTPQAAYYSVATGCCGAQSIRDGGMVFAVPKLTNALEMYDFSGNSK